ncbi:MAG: hypothetical protein ABI091_14810 [Ferruginibacter sp.]
MEKNKEFIWTDWLVTEFNKRLESYYRQGHSHESAMILFKKQNTEEAKPTILNITDINDKLEFGISTLEQEVSIKKDRLAEILINEQYMFESVKMGNKDVIAPPQTAIVNGIKTTGERYGDIANENYYRNKMYTHKEYIQALEDCYNASRLTNPLVGFKYDTFSDYMNSRNK